MREREIERVEFTSNVHHDRSHADIPLVGMLALWEGILLVADHRPVGRRSHKGRRAAGSRGGKAPRIGPGVAGNPPPVVEGASGNAALCHRSTRDEGFGHGSRRMGRLRDCSRGAGRGGHSCQMPEAGMAGVQENGTGHDRAGVACRVESGAPKGKKTITWFTWSEL